VAWTSSQNRPLAEGDQSKGKMKTMNKLLVTAGAAAVLMATTAQAAYDGTLSITRNAGYFTGSGGEFTISALTGGLSSLVVGGPNSYSATSFQTFCIETGEHFDNGLPGTYDANINSGAIKGGVGSIDPLSVGTSWLYSQFRAGTLGGYNYTVGALREAQAGLLQNAFWMLEQEIAYDSTNP
jgi:hypothetical protein